MKYTPPQKGFAVIISVLIFAAIGTVISTSLLFLSVSAAQTAIAMQESSEANNLANACAEIALQKLVTSSAFVGTATTTLAQGTCNYGVAAAGAAADKIKAVGTVGTTVRRVQISIAIPQLVIFSWTEVGDFN
ncbi:MAG TPA: hypothetical protein VGP13_02120 [Candidatus Paceibacterota bacterium]|jgi:hypothetical protein|nr:hypothetical protein [Candidatus Paceibacterota bacterium]